MEVREKLKIAQGEALVVRIARSSFEDGSDLGYVAALGDELLLLLCISTGIHFNGFSVLRIDDISDLEAPHDHADFVEEALRLRGESVDEAPPVDLEDMGTALRTAAASFPLLTLHREAVDAEVCHIGGLAGTTRESVSLIEIDPDAEWHEDPARYPLAEVTRVDFGGAYEDALALVGGDPPRVRHLRPVP